MSGDFEKNISHQLESFQLNPSPQVWERVVAALPEKRRRHFAIWWLLPLAACLCGGVWLLVGKQKNSDDKQTAVPNHKTAVNDNKLKKIINPPVNTAEQGTLQPDDEQKAAVNENRTHVPYNRYQAKEIVNGYSLNVSKSPLQTHTLIGTHQEKFPLPENALFKRYSEIQVTQSDDSMYTLDPAAGNTAIQRVKNNDSVYLNKTPIPPLVDSVIISLPDALAKNDSALANKSDTLSGNTLETTASKLKNKNKRAAWTLIVGAGVSSLSSSSSSMNKSLDAINLNTSVGQTGSIGGVFRNPTGNFNISTGVMRSQTISKHFSWQAGIIYQYLTAKQRVGGRNDSLPQFNALANIAFFRTNSMTNDQGTTFQWNRVHRLQIAPGIVFTLNPQARSPLRFLAGLAIAYTISNHLLLHDYRSGSYIRSAKLSNKIMFGWEEGIDVYINHQIHAGVSYQHDFTNIAKANTVAVFHWNQLQLRVGIPLSKYK